MSTETVMKVWGKLAEVFPNVKKLDLWHALKAIQEIGQRIKGRHCGDLGDKLMQYLSFAQYVRRSGTKTADNLEIGSLFGGSCLMKLFAMRDLGVIGKIVCIDPMSGFYGQKIDPLSGFPVTREIFYENIIAFGFDHSVVDLRCYMSDNPDALQGLEADTFATIMIDGDHSYDGINNDWQTYSKFLKTDGVILIDDYSDPAWPDITIFIDELLASSRNDWKLQGQFGTTMLIGRGGLQNSARPGAPLQICSDNKTIIDALASVCYTRSLKKTSLNDGQQYTALIGLAKCRLTDNNYTDAWDLIIKAMHLSSVKEFNKVQGILEVGWLLDKHGLTTEAESLYTLAIQFQNLVDEHRYDLSVRLANSCWSKGDTDSSANYYRQALDIGGIPERRKFFPLLGLGRYHISRKEYALALACLSNAISKPDVNKGNHAQAMAEISACHKALGSLNETQVLKDRSNAWNPAETWSHINSNPGRMISSSARASYATVEEYNILLEKYPTIAQLSGDLKNFQRPWVVDSILKQVPRGGRVLEIGADKCELADLFQQCGYEVWVIDIFEEFGGGVAKFEEVRSRFPNIHFTRGFIHEDITLPNDHFDAIYSCSVIEHNQLSDITATFDRVHQCLKTGGKSIHAIDFTVEGPILKNHGLINAVLSWHSVQKTAEVIGNEALNDIDSFYLSPQGHYNWRRFLCKSYEDYPYRKVTSLNIISTKN